MTSSAQDAFVREHQPMITWAMRRVRMPLKLYDEAYSAGLRTLWRCAKTFDPSLGFQPSTLISGSLFRALSGVRRQDSRKRPCAGFNDEDILFVQDDPPRDDDRLCVRLLECLPEKEALIVSLRFGIGCPVHYLREIGDIFGVSKERVRQIVVRACVLMRDFATDEGIQWEV